MNHKQRSLYLDESGKADPSHPSKTFILSACSFPTNNEIEIRNTANKIIFKYWGSERSYKTKYKVNSIIFHSIDMATKNGPFKIFNQKGIEEKFWKDFHSQILCRQDINYYIVLIDKNKTNKVKGWTKTTTLKKVYKEIINQFCVQLTKNKETGQIIAESSFDQDLSLVTAFNSIQRNSYKIYKDPFLISKTITSLSLVNKHDNSIGSQIADIMSWVGKNKFLIENTLKDKNKLSKEEEKTLKLFNNKINSKADRNKFNLYKIYP